MSDSCLPVDVGVGWLPEEYVWKSPALSHAISALVPRVSIFFTRNFLYFLKQS